MPPVVDLNECSLCGACVADCPGYVLSMTDEGPLGDAVIEIALSAGEDILARFEVFGPTTDARLWVVPAELVNSRGEFRIHDDDSPDDGEDG